MVETKGVVLSDDFAVDVWKPEEDREDGDTKTGKDNGESDSGL